MTVAANVPDSEWTVGTLKAFMDLRNDMQGKLDEERDRRYAEVRGEQEKALKIKEAADEKALGLEKENRAYKDEKANNLRSQIEGERGMYALKTDISQLEDKIFMSIKPINEFISRETGKSQGIQLTTAGLLGIISGLVGLLALGATFFRMLGKG